MTSAASLFDRAAAAHQRLQDASAALVLFVVAEHFGVARDELFRDTRWPTPSAKARAVAVYILVTYFGLDHEDAAASIGLCTHRKNVWRFVTIVSDERERDAELDLFCDDIGRLVERRRAA